MADFYQTGVITTLHRFPPTNIDRTEAELKRHARTNPVALLLPCLYSELQGEALPRIVEELKRVRYLKQIVISLGRATEEEFKHARAFFSALPQEKALVWNNGPRITAVYEQLTRNGIHIGESGKGRDVWIGIGFILADEKAQAVVLHDCDIVTYHREMLARLCYPVSSPNLAYEYAKGYYARINGQFFGRVTRLFVHPLIRTLQKVVGYHPFLVFLDSFRYPLAGEFAMTTDLARVIRVPSDWGLEIGLLGEVFRNCATRRVCEVDLCETYEHKHKPLSQEDPQAGLMRMAVDIAKTLFRTLAAEGVVLSEGFLRSLVASYVRMAQDTVKKYNDDAAINGLQFDRHAEGTAVEAFAKAIGIAGRAVLEDPMGAPQISNWSRVTSAVPEVFDLIKQAVAEDSK
jgi:glucosyl-3-phosphoglycerate synthase